MKKIYLVRHGPVCNPERRIYGWSDVSLADSPDAVRSVIPEGVLENVAVIVSSDLTRCRVAAQCLVDTLDVPLVISQSIREQSFGDWENMTWDEIKEKHPVAWKHFFDDWIYEKPPNGESFHEMSQRVLSFLDERKQQPGEEIWITHSGPIRAILCRTQNLSLTQSFEMDCLFYQFFDLELPKK